MTKEEDIHLRYQKAAQAFRLDPYSNYSNLLVCYERMVAKRLSNEYVSSNYRSFSSGDSEVPERKLRP